MIVSWPKGITGRGMRRQFVDIIDITPTVPGIAGAEAPGTNFDPDKRELYNLAEDFSQSENLAAKL